ncbi:MAG: prepilin-type N-terminal cleavage/methylation domain-containing protein [Myxococcota bacterium]
MRRRLRSASARRGGFTIIEVMMAITVLAIGAVGLMGLVQATVRGNQQGRRITTATQVARTWLERVRTDTIGWTTNTPGGTATTCYLQNAPAVAVGASSGWFVPQPGGANCVDVGGLPAASEVGIAAGAAWTGADAVNSSGIGNQARYCTLLRVTWVVAGEMLRADVRTWWDDSSEAQLAPNCGLGNEADIVAELDGPIEDTTLRSVETSTLVRWRQQ